MRLEVDTGGYRSATEVCYAANHGLTDAIAVLTGDLRSGGAMAGQDTGGRQWAASYDGVADELVRAGADLGGSLGAVANLLNASLVNHEGADYSARIGGPGGGPTGDTDPDHGCERFLPAALPSAAGGCGGAPAGWHWLADHLQGYLWPDADTDALRAAGSAWQRAAGALTSTGWSVDAARIDIEGQTSPEVGPAGRVCGQLMRHCDDLAATYQDVARACTGYAEQVEEHRREVVSILKELLAWTVVDQVTGAVLSFFTAGAAEVAAQLAESGILATYAARVINVLRRLVELARAAAELMGAGVAKVAAMTAWLRRIFSVQVVHAMEEAADLELQRSLSRVRRLLQYSEEGAGHTLTAHTGLSDEELAARLASRPRFTAASSFTDERTAVREINKILDNDQGKIEQWLGGIGSRPLRLDGDAGSVIGHTVTAEGVVSEATSIRVVLIRDAGAPDGYSILTSFPQ